MKIKIRDLFYLYSQDGRANVALRGLNLEIASGECLVVNGPNGSGKSTLVKILTGFERSSAGAVEFGDLDISKMDPVHLRREFVSSIDQKGNLLVDLTVKENIALACSLKIETLSSANFRTNSLLEEYRLNDLADKYPSELSASQRQLCALAVALATSPQILVADEPSGELDDGAAETFYQTLATLSGVMTVILVTHDPRAEVIADRVVRIRNGRISQSWLPGEEEINVVDPFGWSHSPNSVEAPPKKQRRGKDSDGPLRAPLLGATGLSLNIGERKIFSDLTFAAAPGEFIAVSGPAGSGKSSLLRILAGVQRPSLGMVNFEGKNIHQLNRDESARLRSSSISYMSQGNDPLENISLRDHLALSENDLKTLLGDIGAHSERSLSEFSGGERARIEILKLLALGKPLLLLDEPTSQLDEMRTEDVITRMKEYLRAGGIIIASTRERSLLQIANSILKL